MKSLEETKLHNDKDKEQGLLGSGLFRPTSVSRGGKASGENLHVENGAESVQADLIVDLNYNSRVIHD